MNSGELEEGSMVLRAKIDMANPNMHFRDPIIYRIVKTPHHRTGDKWKAYPMYDFAHGQSDFFEGVTHSLCTLEFVVHRPLYDLFIDWLKEGKDLNDNRPRQTEFNKLNLSYTLMSKRNLLILVKEGLVHDWDDPRMPTICGFRRRGYSPEAIHKFIDKIGYTTYDALNEFALLESAVREDLNTRATRVSAVLNPVKLIITNYPEGQVEEMEAINNPEDLSAGSHTIEFSRELWIEREDFMEDAPKKFFRMTPGQEVRLKNAYIVKCTGCKKDENGEITEIYCEYDPNTKSGMPDSNRKVKGTLHWLSCAPLSAGRSPSIRPPVESGKPARRDGGYPRSKKLLAFRSNERDHQPGLLESIDKLLCRKVPGRLQTARLPTVPAYRLFQCR